MSVLDPSRQLSKELNLLGVYAISVGATMSSGFFLLPGLAAAEAGPAVVLSYLIALLPLVPGIVSKVELSTAMPRAGGAYYFLDRALGPLFGTISGLGTWLALVLKVAFALVGLGAYLGLFWSGAPIVALAVGLAIAFGLINWLGARHTGRFQVWLVAVLLALITGFMIHGGTAVEVDHFAGFFDKGSRALLSTAGLVCVSYIGLTKVASLSEEVKSPERNLPIGMFLAVLTTVVVYAVGTAVMVGVLPMDQLAGSLTPVADTARVLVGRWGMLLMTAAAVLAFFSVANAGIMSASRYPFAMSRDNLAPSFFRELGRFRTPTSSIAATVAVIIVAVLVLDPLRIAKLAASFQLMLFAFNCAGVIVMRESRIESYDPGYLSPFYPWMQLVGIVAPFILIVEMGWMPTLFSAGVVVAGIAWFTWYGKRRVHRHGAIYHVFERLGRKRFEELDRELRGILKEKGLRAQDPFDEIVVRAVVLDIDDEQATFESVVELASAEIGGRLDRPADTVARGFLEGTRTGATPVTGGVALPHLRLPDIAAPLLVLARCRLGLEITTADVFGHAQKPQSTYAIFFLVSPDDDPGRHLRVLAQLASRVDREDFIGSWLTAEDELRLKEILLRHERYLTLRVAHGEPTEAFVGRAIHELDLPDGCLVAVIRRDGATIIPRGGTVLEEGDVLTIIGQVKAVQVLLRTYGGEG